MKFLKFKKRFLRHALGAPFIFSVIIPFVIMDLWVEMYHRICFKLYKIPYVERSRYLKFDRHHLKYLTFFQKIYCLYCSYGNGLVNYWVKIAGETEIYWCGIKHHQDRNFIQPEHQKNFAEYGNEQDFIDKYKS